MAGILSFSKNERCSMAMAKAILEKWAVAQKRHHLSDKQVQMARVMGTYKLCKVQALIGDK